MTDQTTATLPATDQATFSRTGLLFGALCLVALIAPLVHVKPNRILAGEGLALPLALNAPIGWVISATLLALTAATLSRRRRAMQLVGLALIGLGLTILSLGLAARQLSPEGNAIIRIAPGWGFWLLVLVFAMMLVDALARVRLALRWRLAALVLGTGGLLSLLTSGWFDHVSVMVAYHLRQDMFRDSLHQHVALAFGSLALALCVGVPLGVAAHAFRRLGGPLLAGLNIIQTIPSLALFGLLIPLFGWVASTIPGAAAVGVAGIGRFPALVALFLYALLPVVSNTRAGLDAVSPPVHDAAVSLGMTRLQILWQVELPLALPAILAATRIVLVQNIGLTVIAGLIGGGGFGSFVFQGLNQASTDMILLGALPTIFLAVLAGLTLDLAVEATGGTARGPA